MISTTVTMCSTLVEKVLPNIHFVRNIFVITNINGSKHYCLLPLQSVEKVQQKLGFFV